MLKRNAQGYGILPRRAQLELLALQVAIDRRQIDTNRGRNSVHSESIAFDMGFYWVHSEPILWDFSVHVNIFLHVGKKKLLHFRKTFDRVLLTNGRNRPGTAMGVAAGRYPPETCRWFKMTICLPR
jgi:hypothetical protein